jgi:hypothetical protein
MNRREWLGKVGGTTAGVLMSQLVGTGAAVAAPESAKPGVENDTGIRLIEIHSDSVRKSELGGLLFATSGATRWAGCVPDSRLGVCIQ